jgi:hypothetical protein
MRESDKVRGIIKGAIESAFIDFPTDWKWNNVATPLQTEAGMRDTSNGSSGGP